MESRPLLTRIPDQEILVGENPSHASDHIRRHTGWYPGQNDATYIMVYLPYYKSFTDSIPSVIAGNNLKIWWYNPRNRRCLSAGHHGKPGEL